jgi:hypothetical protein
VFRQGVLGDLTKLGSSFRPLHGDTKHKIGKHRRSVSLCGYSDPGRQLDELFDCGIGFAVTRDELA